MINVHNEVRENGSLAADGGYLQRVFGSYPDRQLVTSTVLVKNTHETLVEKRHEMRQGMTLTTATTQPRPSDVVMR